MGNTDFIFQRLFAESPIGMAVYDFSGRCIKANDAIGRLVGATVEEVLAQNFNHIKSWKESGLLDTAIEAVTTNKSTQRKTSATTSYGKKLTLSASFQPFSGEGENYLLLTCYEITERQLLEEALREQEAKYRELVENTQDLITRVDRDGNFTFVNHSSMEIHGLSPEECIGLSAFDFVHPDDKEPTRKWFMEHVAEGKTRGAFENRQVNRITGHLHNVYWSTFFEYDESGEFIGAGSIARDLTPIRSAEQNFKNLFEKMLDGFALHEIICDDKGKPVDYRFLQINPAFEAQTGLKARDLIGKTVLEVMPGIEKYWIDTYGRVALTGEPISFENYAEVLGKHFEITAYSPEKKQFACIFQDISERKKREQEKANLERQLRQAYKMEAIGTMAGGIAHDFNNILAIILGNADMARDDIPEGNPARYNIDQVLKASNRAKELVKQILTFSRQSEKKLQPVKPCSAIQESLKLLRSTAPTTVSIMQDVCKECCSIMADVTQLHQLLMNLFSNAVHAMDEKGTLGVVVEIVNLDTDDIDQHSGLNPGQHLKIMVSDTGSGMDDDTRERVFDPFFTTKEVDEGTGMGLSIVLGIVKSHNGFIELDSTLGEGSTFSIYFPAMKDEALGRNEVENGDYPQGHERILFVDDEEMLAEMGRRMLEKQGYQVTVKTSSPDALEIFRSAPEAFDLVITDQSMPDMSGSELSAELLKVRANIPIILCTGYSRKISEEKAKELGIKEFCTKPLDRKGLSHVVRKALDADSLP